MAFPAFRGSSCLRRLTCCGTLPGRSLTTPRNWWSCRSSWRRWCVPPSWSPSTTAIWSWSSSKKLP